MAEAMLKVYVWDEPFKETYAGGMIVAVAPDLETAKEQVKLKRGDGTERAGVYPYFLTIKGELGEPTTVHDLADGPFAETYEWME